MILLITFSQDFYNIDLVKENLEKKGYPSMRINIDEFPSRMKLTTRLNNNKKFFFIGEGKDRIDTNDIKAVWLRRHWAPIISEDIDPVYRAGCIRESQEVTHMLLSHFNPNIILDPLDNISLANNKRLQLVKAAKSGLNIPETLITNSGEELKEFFYEQAEQVVAKLLTPLSASMQGGGLFLYTSKVAKEHLDDVEMLSHSPMCFQRLIPKAYELRIIYVEGNFFTGKIDARASKKGAIDWRRSEPGEANWEKYELPKSICEKISAMMISLDLCYGAIDMICTPSGEYVFLEVNPMGEWGMIQRDLNYPIAEAIADALIKRHNLYEEGTANNLHSRQQVH